MRWRYMIALPLLIFGMPQASQAAPSLPPLYFTSFGALWSWSADRGAQQVSTWAFNHIPTASSDRAYIAFAATDQGAMSNLLAAGAKNVDFIDQWTNINLATMDNPVVQTIAGQPKDTKYTALDDFTAITRSNPAWSADGQAVAWAEYAFKETPKTTSAEGSRLIVYEAASTSEMSYPLPLDYGSDIPEMTTLWGKTGIAISSIFNEGVGDLYVYSATGKQISHHSFGFGLTSNEYALEETPIWLKDRDREYLGSVSHPYMLNIFLNAGLLYDGVLEMSSSLAPNGLRVSFKPDEDHEGDCGLCWKIVEPSGKVVFEAPTRLGPTYLNAWHGFAIAPDGQHIAFIDEHENEDSQYQFRVMIYYDGQVTQAFSHAYAYENVPTDYRRVQGLTWGPVQWQVR